MSVDGGFAVSWPRAALEKFGALHNLPEPTFRAGPGPGHSAEGRVVLPGQSWEPRSPGRQGVGS